MPSLHLTERLSRGSVSFTALPRTRGSGGRPVRLGLSFFPSNVCLAFGINIEDSAISGLDKKRVAEG